MSKYWRTSWNPAVGCERVSEGCKNCWAMKLHNQRHKANCHVAAGAVMGRLPAPKARAADVPLPMPAQYDLPFSHIQLFPDRLSQPLHWRKPRTVAVCFMGDLFHEQVPDEFLDDVFAVMALAFQHTYLVLTKRPQRMHDYFALDADARFLSIEMATDALLQRTIGRGTFLNSKAWPLPNVWLGVTAENQRMADERIPLLLKTPAAHRWVSLEPLLGPIDLCGLGLCCSEHLPGHLDWVVVGGESGPGHRRMELAWADSISEQCYAAKVPYYGKQIAANRPGQPLPGALGRKDLPW